MAFGSRLQFYKHVVLLDLLHSQRSVAQRFQAGTDRMISDGEHYAAQLHEVSHDTGYPGVDYSAVRLWQDAVVEVLRARKTLLS